MNFYCTHFDINYTGHARSLYDSLCRHEPSFRLFMFCMDEASMDHLSALQLEHATLISYKELEAFTPGLTEAKNNRSRVEYFYTCSPATCFYILKNFAEVPMITYLDSDLFFFSSPAPLYAALGNASIGIISHRFHWTTKRNSIYGNFNVGWINFRKDSNGLQCLEEWMNDCIAWCYQRLEDGKYADQKYLDAWPGKYENVHILQHKGANLAVWNIGNYKLSLKGRNIMVDDDQLIFYHFANLKQLAPDKFTSDLSRVFVKTSTILRDHIYMPYIRSLLKFQVKSIVSKKNINDNKLKHRIKEVSRVIRQFIFPDIITIK
jgi:hypothetical protein